MVDNKMLDSHPAFGAMTAQLVQARSELDEALLNKMHEHKQAQSKLAALRAEVPALRKAFLSAATHVEGKKVQQTLQTVEDAVYFAERKVADCQLEVLALKQRRAEFMIGVCGELRAERETDILPVHAELEAILREFMRQSTALRNIPAEIGRLEREQDVQAAERQQQLARERLRAESMERRRHVQEEYAT